MILGYDSNLDNETYFGIFSEIQKIKAIQILNNLGIRHEFRGESRVEKEILISWGAFDDSSYPSGLVWHLWILDDDMGKLGDAIKDNFPEKTYIL